MNFKIKLSKIILPLLCVGLLSILPAKSSYASETTRTSNRYAAAEAYLQSQIQKNATAAPDAVSKYVDMFRDAAHSASMFSKDGAAQNAAETYYKSLSKMRTFGETMCDILAGTGGSTISTTLHQYIRSIFGSLMPPLMTVGYALSTLFFVIAFFHTAAEDRGSGDIYFKLFFKWALAIGLISSSPVICEAIYDFSGALATLVSGLTVGLGNTTPTGDTIDAATLAAYFRASMDYGISATSLLFNSWLTGIIIWIICLALEGVSYVIAFSRMIEIGARAATIPIGLALIADDGWRGAGGRLIKKYAAVCCQSFVLIVISKCVVAIMAHAQTSIVSSLNQAIANQTSLDASLSGQLVIIIGVAVASISVMHKSMGLINDALGA